MVLFYSFKVIYGFWLAIISKAKCGVAAQYNQRYYVKTRLPSFKYTIACFDVMEQDKVTYNTLMSTIPRL